MQKVAIITGAAQGIGKIIATTLLDHDYRIVAMDKNSEKLKKTFNDSDTVLTYVGDVGMETDVKAAVSKALEKYGRIDLVVNNAAQILFKPLEDVTYDSWQQVMNTNLGSVFLFAKYAKKALRIQKGSIINIASTRAYMSEPDTESYSASKGGIIALTHSLAISLGPDIRVNSISPGWIDSRDDAQKAQEPISREEHALHPCGRVGKPQDVASMVLWLADNANSFVTGQDFIIDGGMTKKMIY